MTEADLFNPGENAEDIIALADELEALLDALCPISPEMVDAELRFGRMMTSLALLTARKINGHLTPETALQAANLQAKQLIVTVGVMGGSNGG